jgi:starch phosphorylase
MEVELSLDDLEPAAVRVELYADGRGGGQPVRVEMARARSAADGEGRTVYRASVPSTRPASDYTVRVIPQHSQAAVPLECARILWQH